MGLEDVLSEKSEPEIKQVEVKPVEVKPEPEIKPEVEPEIKEPVKAKVEKEVKKEEPLTERERAFLSKAEDERRKRQELERKLSAPKEPKDEPKQFWDDPEGSLKSFEQKMYQEITKTRLNTAEMVARSRHPDFDENVEIFSQMLENNPALFGQWTGSPDPAEFAYKMGKNHKELQEAGDLDKLKAKIEKETRLRIEAELKEKAETLQKEKESIPQTLSEVRGTSGSKVQYTGPTPLEAILRR